jgi:hypothetical protein
MGIIVPGDWGQGEWEEGPPRGDRIIRLARGKAPFRPVVRPVRLVRLASVHPEARIVRGQGAISVSDLGFYRIFWDMGG